MDNKEKAIKELKKANAYILVTKEVTNVYGEGKQIKMMFVNLAYHLIKEKIISEDMIKELPNILEEINDKNDIKKEINKLKELMKKFEKLFDEN